MGHGMSWSDAKPSSNNNKNYSDIIEIQRFSEDWTKIRLVGEVFEIKQHWLPTLKKDGKSITSFPRLCLKTGDPNADCPYCNAKLRTQTLYLSNAIIRDIQEDKPESKKKLRVPEGVEWRVKGDTWWSPVRVVQFPASVAQKIQSYKNLNKDKNGKTYDLNHPKFGRDMIVKIDKTQSGSGMYDIQKEDQNKLDEEEREYLLYNIEQVFDCVETEQEAIDTLSDVYNRGNFNEDEYDINKIEQVLNVSKKNKKSRNDDDDDIPDDEDEKPRKKSKIKPSENMDFDDDDDDDEDEKPKKKGKKKVDDDDDDLDIEDDDLDDDDEDEKPKKKGKKKIDDDDLDDEDEKPRKKNKKKIDDDDDLDDDDDEDEKPKKKGKKKVEDDDDDLDDDEDEDEKPRKKSKKKIDDDDDLDDDLDDDEDEKPRKKSKKKIDDDDLDDDDEDEKPKKKGKKKIEDDDDLDDDDDEDEKPRKKRSRKN